MSMRAIRRILAALATVAALTGAVAAQRPTLTAQEQKNLKIVLDWWREVLQAHHLELAPKYQAADYIQHNPNIPTGRDAFVQFFGQRGQPVNPIPDVLANPPVVQFAKGDYVGLIWEREGKDPADPSKTYKYNTFDLLRIQNGKVQEHWDYALKAKGAPDGGAPDSPAALSATFKMTPEEKKNVDIANVEFRDILQYGHVEFADKVMAPGYIQHNPNVPSGRDGFVQFFSRIRKPEPLQPGWKNKPMMIIPSGPYVFYMSRRELKNPDDAARMYTTYWFDMVRIENGMIAEHWDAAVKNPPAPPAPPTR